MNLTHCLAREWDEATRSNVTPLASEPEFCGWDPPTGISPFYPPPPVQIGGRLVSVTTQLPATGFYRTEVWSGRE